VRLDAFVAPFRPRPIAAGLSPAPGATSRLLVWWGRADWLAEVAGALTEDLLREGHISFEAVMKVAECMAGFADGSTGRGCRPTNERLVELTGYSLSTVQRARRLLKHLDLVVEVVAGRSNMTLIQRLEAHANGSSHRRIAAEFALCSRRQSPHRNPQPDLHVVDRDTPPVGETERGLVTSRTTHLQSQTENYEEERAPRAAPTKKIRRAPKFDPSARRLAAKLVSHFWWLTGVSLPRLIPLLTPYAQAGWTVHDFDLAVGDSMAARGWRVVPRNLRQPAAYLAELLQSADPADRPSVLEDQLHAAEREHDRLSRHGAPCEHGVPGGEVVSPLTGQRGCPLCRAAG
jgi:hypothetical protein